MRKLGILSTVVAMSAAMGILTGTSGSRRRTGGKTLSQWHDPARVDAAADKRDARQERNLRNARGYAPHGGYVL